MGFVITFCFVMIGIAIAQLVAILYYMKYGEKIVIRGEYAPEVENNTRVVMKAVESGEIKKHILTNSAEKYDSGKTLKQYQKFLGSELMADIMHISEEHYNG